MSGSLLFQILFTFLYSKFFLCIRIYYVAQFLLFLDIRNVIFFIIVFLFLYRLLCILYKNQQNISNAAQNKTPEFTEHPV